MLVSMTVLHMGFTKKHYSVALAAFLMPTGYHEEICDPATGAIQSAFWEKKERPSENREPYPGKK